MTEEDFEDCIEDPPPSPPPLLLVPPDLLPLPREKRRCKLRSVSPCTSALQEGDGSVNGHKPSSWGNLNLQYYIIYP